MDATELDQMLRAAGVPVDGCAVGTEDKATWRVDFSTSATAAQRTQAAALIAAYVPLTDVQKRDLEALRSVDQKYLQAVALALWECIPAPLLTRAQMKARAVAIFKTL